MWVTKAVSAFTVFAFLFGSPHAQSLDTGGVAIGQTTQEVRNALMSFDASFVQQEHLLRFGDSRPFVGSITASPARDSVREGRARQEEHFSVAFLPSSGGNRAAIVYRYWMAIIPSGMRLPSNQDPRIDRETLENSLVAKYGEPTIRDDRSMIWQFSNGNLVDSLDADTNFVRNCGRVDLQFASSDRRLPPLWFSAHSRGQRCGTVVWAYLGADLNRRDLLSSFYLQIADFGAIAVALEAEAERQRRRDQGPTPPTGPGPRL